MNLTKYFSKKLKTLQTPILHLITFFSKKPKTLVKTVSSLTEFYSWKSKTLERTMLIFTVSEKKRLPLTIFCMNNSEN